MAPSLRGLAATLIQLNTFASVALAATVTYDFNVSWVERDPLGSGSRKVMGINGQWPIPTVEVNMGDRLIVNLHNQMDVETTSLHWHGLFQNGTTHMDGAAGVSQCGVPPGGSFTYNFTVDQPGTYWYHSHVRGQYPDGLRGPLIVHDTSNPFKGKYDEEIVMTVSDWYNDMPSELISNFISYANPTGAEPVPNGALLNDTQNLTVSVQPGKTYMFRFANIGAFASQYLWFEGHNMTIIEVDGVYTQPQEAEMIYITAAQRYAALITMKNDTTTNFAIQASMDTVSAGACARGEYTKFECQDLFDSIPEGLNTNVTGWLVYDEKKPNPDPTLLDDWSMVFDDFTLQPYDNQTLLDKVDYSITLNLTMDNLGDGANYAFFNDVTYVAPKVPTLYTALTTGAMSTNAQVYGDNTNAFVLKTGDVVEIVVNNMDGGKHPFHIHGHTTQVVFRPDDESGVYDPSNATYPAIPMKRDTMWVKPNSNMVLRFTADNPGVWLFHCHLEWHMASGLIATLIESPTDLQKSLTIPQAQYNICKAQNILTAGNAAGNTVDLLDLSGENKSPDPLPAGFTARGIVALIFSCISAFLGMAVIGWYGSRPMTSSAAADKLKAVVATTEGSESAEGVSHGQPMAARTQ